MNPTRSDIFGRLDWLTSRVRNLLGRVSALEGSTAKPGGGNTDSEGNYIGIENAAAVPVEPGADHSIPDFSGMLIVNDHYNGGVEVWICGGGGGVLVSRTNYGPGRGDVSINGNGYIWTNTSNQVGPFTFTVIKTRNGS